jgi:hypothetical protein
MNKLSTCLAALLAILIAAQSNTPFDPPPAVLTSNAIRAARDKFDAEMKADIKRPWHGMDLTGRPNGLEKRKKHED